MKIVFSTENLCGVLFFAWLIFMAIAFIVGCFIVPNKTREREPQEEETIPQS